jgi:hypothetical protein
VSRWRRSSWAHLLLQPGRRGGDQLSGRGIQQQHCGRVRLQDLPYAFQKLGQQALLIHTGEMEHGPGGEVCGIAVHTGARVATLAGPGEILVSRTIRDLVAGARSGWKPAVSTSSRAYLVPGRSSQSSAEGPPGTGGSGPARPGNGTTKLTQAAHPVPPRHWRPITGRSGRPSSRLTATPMTQPNRPGVRRSKQ